MNSQAQLSAAQQLAQSGGNTISHEKSAANNDDSSANANEDEGPVDETGVDAKDIELVMAQVRIFCPLYCSLSVICLLR